MSQNIDASGMHILITGGAGFIGSNLAEQLINDGIKVTVLDNLLTGRIANIAHSWRMNYFILLKATFVIFKPAKMQYRVVRISVTKPPLVEPHTAAS